MRAQIFRRTAALVWAAVLLCVSAFAAAESGALYLEVTGISYTGDQARIDLLVDNQTGQSVSFGWTSSCELTVTTADGQKRGVTLRSLEYKFSTGQTVVTIPIDNCPGEVSAVNLSDLRQLEASLPSKQVTNVTIYDREAGVAAVSVRFDGGNPITVHSAAREEAGSAEPDGGGGDFYNPDNIVFEEGKVSIRPVHVRWEDGSLLATCYVLNGFDNPVEDIQVDELTFSIGDGTIVASGSFGELEGLRLDASAYEEWTFRFLPDAVRTPGEDISQGILCEYSVYFQQVAEESGGQPAQTPPVPEGADSGAVSLPEEGGGGSLLREALPLASALAAAAAVGLVIGYRSRRNQGRADPHSAGTADPVPSAAPGADSGPRHGGTALYRSRIDGDYQEFCKSLQAEDYNAAAVKARRICETMLNGIREEPGNHCPPWPEDCTGPSSLLNKMRFIGSTGLVSRQTMDRYHNFRRYGNRGAHAGGTEDSGVTRVEAELLAEHLKAEIQIYYDGYPKQ